MESKIEEGEPLQKVKCKCGENAIYVKSHVCPDFILINQYVCYHCGRVYNEEESPVEIRKVEDK